MFWVKVATGESNQSLHVTSTTNLIVTIARSKSQQRTGFVVLWSLQLMHSLARERGVWYSMRCRELYRTMHRTSQLRSATIACKSQAVSDCFQLDVSHSSFRSFTVRQSNNNENPLSAHLIFEPSIAALYSVLCIGSPQTSILRHSRSLISTSTLQVWLNV